MPIKQSQVVSKFLLYLLFLGIASCQLNEIEEVVERSRQRRPTWVKMMDTEGWTAGHYSYIVLRFESSSKLRELDLKRWLEMQKQSWANGTQDQDVQVADLYYEKVVKDLGQKTQTLNRVYALLKKNS